MNWSTTDGRSWSITIGDAKAVIWLIDEECYGASIRWSDGSSTLLEEFGCIKEAKRACLDEIGRTIDLNPEAKITNRPHPVVWCVLGEGGYMRRRCGCVKTFTDRDKRSSLITETKFRHYTGEQE